MIRTMIKRNHYMDSIFLMNASREMLKVPSVNNVVAVMGSDMNKTVLSDFGGLTEEAKDATANDLIISLDLDDEKMLAEAEKKLNEMIGGTKKPAASASAKDAEYKTLSIAAEAKKDANIAIISVPAEFALEEAKSAVEHDMNLFIFSDMPLAEELELKAMAKEKGLFVMGPGAGTAVINNISLGLMSKVRSGNIGVVAASGSGLQEVCVLAHQYGAGISQAIGTGGHDLSETVGGITMLMGMDYLSNDPETDVIVLVSKPPHPKTAKKIYGNLSKNKPTVIFFLGGNPDEIRAAGAYAPATLEEAAEMAFALANGKEVTEKDAVEDIKKEYAEMAKMEKAKLNSGQKYLRGLFCGGTHSEETVWLLQSFVANLHSNLAFGHVETLENRHISVENSLVDMGDEEFTKGRPHPVMDPSILVPRLIQEAKDPETAVILFDLLFGYAIHPDPAGAIEEALIEINSIMKRENRYISLIASLCGTDLDPQDVAEQRRRLEAYGVKILPSNAKAAVVAGLIVA
jgi:FdrA protein